MTLNEYQIAASRTNKGTAVYKWGSDGHVQQIIGMYNALGLCGEAGECAEKIKKLARDGGDFATVRTAVTKELGDVLWYLSQLAQDFSVTLGEVARGNLEKLRDRAIRNVLHGSGDNR